MTDTRYFIFNSDAAFDTCRKNGFVWDENALCPDNEYDTVVLETPVLDSGTDGNVWQRVFADMTADEGAKIVWRVYTSDSRDVLNIPEVFTAFNCGDFLPVGAQGRYLRLVAEITGSVKLRSLQIYQSWESFLDYLPEIYRDYDSFFDRFLRVFSVQYLDLERRISKLPGTFDPAVAPPETLRWLAEMVGVRHINLWETQGLRRLLVSGIYRRRGQFSVFADFIEYFTGCKPFIAEHYRYLSGNEENDRMYTDGDVTVFLPPEAGQNTEAMRTVIDDFLPGDVMCRIIVLDPYPVVGSGAYLGINTHVGRYEQTTIGTSRIGITVIGGTV